MLCVYKNCKIKIVLYICTYLIVYVVYVKENQKLILINYNILINQKLIWSYAKFKYFIYILFIFIRQFNFYLETF